MTTPIARPSLEQTAGYLVGRRLPDEYTDWVIQDITGDGATRRYTARFLTPLVPLLAICFFVPGSVIIRLGMVLLLLVPFIYFVIALKPIYQRHRLVSHGLDPALLTVRRQETIDREAARYVARYRSTSDVVEGTPHA